MLYTYFFRHSNDFIGEGFVSVFYSVVSIVGCRLEIFDSTFGTLDSNFNPVNLLFLFAITRIFVFILISIFLLFLLIIIIVVITTMMFLLLLFLLACRSTTTTTATTAVIIFRAKAESGSFYKGFTSSFTVGDFPFFKDLLRLLRIKDYIPFAVCKELCTLVADSEKFSVSTICLSWFATPRRGLIPPHTLV